MICLTRKHLYVIASIVIDLPFHGTLLMNQSFDRKYDATILIFLVSLCLSLGLIHGNRAGIPKLLLFQIHHLDISESVL